MMMMMDGLKVAAVFLTVSACSLVIQGQSNGDLRLIGSTSSSGRLEIFLNGQWGTICSNGIRMHEADIACRQLNSNFLYATRASTVSELGFSQGTGVIHYGSVTCDRTDTRLIDCTTTSIAAGNCDHSKDLAITCSNQPDPVRLVSEDGRTSGLSGGRIEIFINNTWGTVCDNSFGIPDGQGVCRSLGFITSTGFRRTSSLGVSQVDKSVPIWLSRLECSSSNSNLRLCATEGTGVTADCGHDEDIWVSCTGSGALRLVTPSTRSPNADSSSFKPYGRLEVYNNGEWGTVCDDGFTIVEATSACRQLGFSRAYREDQVGFLGTRAGSGRIWLDNVRCPSSTTPLLQCSHNGFGVNDCGHIEDVAIECFTGNTVTTSVTISVSGSGFDLIGLIVGVSVAGAVLLIILPIVIICIVVCCVAGAAGTAASRQRTTTATTSATAGSGTKSGRNQATNWNEKPPPSYNETQNQYAPYPSHVQHQGGAYPPQQSAPSGAYPPQQPAPSGAYPPQQPSGYPPQQPGGYPPRR